MEALASHDMVFGVGPAGTGKTYLAVAMGVSLLLAGKVERIVLSRPAVEAGERLGFLPGDMKEKVDPYLRPLYDALYDLMGFDKVAKLFERTTEDDFETLRDLRLLVEVDPRQGTHQPAAAPAGIDAMRAGLDELRARPKRHFNPAQARREARESKVKAARSRLRRS